jgi:hypothetical protein
MELAASMAISEVKKNGVFVLPGIGRLVRVDRKARTGRNPATGEVHQDSGQEGREVPRGQSRERRDRSAEEEVMGNGPMGQLAP